MLAGTNYRVIQGIDIHCMVIGDIAKYADTLKHVNVVALIGYTRHIV